MVSEVEIPYADQIMSVEFAICLPEASEYHRLMLRDRPDLYTEDVRMFLEAGELVPATRYVQALRVRQLMQRAWAQMFSDIDVIVAPATASPATRVGQETIDWGGGNEEPITPAFVRLSAPANVTGLPSIATPCGFTDDGLPVAFQAIARPFAEATSIRLCDAYQRMTDWASRRPAV